MPMAYQLSRRGVLKWGAAGASVLVAGAVLPNFGISAALAAEFGSGDVAVLNYAYALEQLEAAFYTQVVSSPYKGMNDYEARVFADLHAHEVAHRDFLASALGRARLPDLEVDFSAVDFSSRRSVLKTAQTFEDLGVSAYNGAGQLLTNVGHVAAAGSIVSVEARHASAIRDLIKPLSAFAVGSGVVGSDGLDAAASPGSVFKAAGPFIKTPLTPGAPLV